LTREDIIRMAREAGFELSMWQMSIGCEANGSHEELERFAALVESHVCEREHEWIKKVLRVFSIEEETLKFINAIIKARGNK